MEKGYQTQIARFYLLADAISSGYEFLDFASQFLSDIYDVSWVFLHPNPRHCFRTAVFEMLFYWSMISSHHDFDCLCKKLRCIKRNDLVEMITNK